MASRALPLALGLLLGGTLGFGAGWWVRGAPPSGSPPEAPVTRDAPAERDWVALGLEDRTQVAAPRFVPEGPLPNTLVLVADDVGQDMVSAYGEHPRAPATPHIDALAAQGVLFRHAVANPVCSPTRATLLTGRYSFRYGIGNAIPPRAGWALPPTERLLPAALSDRTGGRVQSAAVGKWHLSTPTVGGFDHPRQTGFAHHVGTMGNLLGQVSGEPQTYFRWLRVVDGEPAPAEGYITSVTVDDALAMMETLPEPWFLYVAFHAAHYPMHLPPRDLYTTPLPVDPSESDLYRAMVESMDTEIGRLMAGLGERKARTNVVFLGDNGSAPVAVEPPWNKVQSKGALTRGGIRVPFVVAGPAVAQPGRETDALVNTTDLYATVVDLLGLDEPLPNDSVSFAPVLADPAAPGPREVAYAERFSPNGPPSAWTYHEAIARDARYKLLVRNGEEIGLYDLIADPMERRNLFRGDGTPELRAALRRLRHALPEVALEKRSGERPADADQED